MKRTWPDIVDEASRIVASYTTSVTLRQLHYRLVASAFGDYVNTTSCYQILSKRTSEARRDGSFPALSDRTRGVARPVSFGDVDEARQALADQYRRDRTEGQDVQVWVLYEKATLGAQIESWTEDYGVPTAAMRGYSSESLEREVFDAMDRDGRPVVAFYLGDLDPEGEDIERNFLAQATRQQIEFEHWQRLTVTAAQIATLGLVPNPGKVGSNRAPAFVAKHGSLFQIEVEAVDPAVVELLVVDAITDPAWFDEAEWEACVAQENADRQSLRRT